jgi:hypothetical protein
MNQTIDIFPVKRSDETLIQQFNYFMSNIIGLVLDLFGSFPVLARALKVVGEIIKDIGNLRQALAKSPKMQSEGWFFWQEKFHNGNLRFMKA